MKIEYIKLGKGHNVIIDNKLFLWVIGSKKNAKKEANIELKKLNLK